MQERWGIDSTFIKQVARDDHKIDMSLYSIIHNIPECAAKIVKTLAHAILLVAQVRIGDMDKRSSHVTLQTRVVLTLSSLHERLRLLLPGQQDYRPAHRDVGFCHW